MITIMANQIARTGCRSSQFFSSLAAEDSGAEADTVSTAVPAVATVEVTESTAPETLLPQALQKFALASIC
jgi:hypothetical protein